MSRSRMGPLAVLLAAVAAAMFISALAPANAQPVLPEAASSGESALAVSGYLRWQWINARYLSFGNEGGDNHGVFLQRYHLGASWRASSQLRLMGELKSNHQRGREPRPLPVDVDRLDVHQAYIDAGPESLPMLRLGRQELQYGAGRRLFTRNGPNVRGNFDAAKLMLRAQDWKIDALAFRPVAVDPGSFDDHTVDGQSFVGVYASGPFAPIAPLQLDLYVLRSHRDGARFEQGAAAERRLSFGLRTFGRAGPWDHDHEITWQTGRSGSAGIAAWSVAGEAGHSWVEADWKPRASLRLTVGSGDRDAGDPRLQTFYSLFPRGGAVDEGFSVSAANMTQGRAALTVKPRAAVEITLALNTQWRTSRRDGVYGPGGGLIRRAAGSDARHIGDSIDLIALWVVHRDVAFDLTAGWFRSGRYVAESGPSRNMTFVTPSLRIRFP